MDLLATFSGLVSLFDQLRMANELQRISGHPVDVLTEIHPLFSPYIVPTLIPLAL
jgi:predicted nucleotidyltransferase